MWPRMVPYGARGIGGVIKRFAPNSRFDPVRRLAPFSATSSPMDKPGRFGYLHTSLCTLSHSVVLSGVKISTRLQSPAISRNLSRRDCVELTGDRGRSQSRPRTAQPSGGACRVRYGDIQNDRNRPQATIWPSMAPRGARADFGSAVRLAPSRPRYLG